jgi:hypothetical protein
MKTGRFTSIWWIVVLVVGVYWVGYFVAVRPSSSPVVFSRNLPPDYRLPPTVQAPAHCLFSPAYFVDSHFLRPARWDALRAPTVLQPPGNQSK